MKKILAIVSVTLALFACGKGGNVITFIMDYENYTAAGEEMSRVTLLFFSIT